MDRNADLARELDKLFFFMLEIIFHVLSNNDLTRMSSDLNRSVTLCVIKSKLQFSVAQ